MGRQQAAFTAPFPDPEMKLVQHNLLHVYTRVPLSSMKLTRRAVGLELQS